MFENAVETVPVFMTACTELHRGLTVDRDETKHLLDHCKHCHTEFDRRQKLRAEYFAEKFSSHVLHRERFHMVMFTVVQDIT